MTYKRKTKEYRVTLHDSGCYYDMVETAHNRAEAIRKAKASYCYDDSDAKRLSVISAVIDRDK